MSIFSLSPPYPLQALFEPFDWSTQTDWLQNFQYNLTDPAHGILLYIRKAVLPTSRKRSPRK